MWRTLWNAVPALVVFCTVGANAGPPLQERARPEPGHLVPVDPYPPGRIHEYLKLCHELLRVTESEAVELFETHKRGTVVMVCRPSFRPEECLALREKDGAREYHLIYTRANRNIFDSMPDDADIEPLPRIKVAKVVKLLDRDRAQRVYDIWERMLRGVRYPEGGPRAGCPDDGETFEFRYAWKGMYGETCTPSRGAPKLLADLGNSLILYCQSQNDQLENTLMRLDKKCEAIERVLDAEDKIEKGRDALGGSREER